MMKKTLISLIIVIFTVLPVFCTALPQVNGFSKRFTRKFKNCDVYIEKITFNMQGTVFHDFKQILGWNGGYCAYKQVTSTANGKLTVTCNFTKDNLNTLYQALLLMPEKFGKANPTEDIWHEMMAKENVCKFEREEYYSNGFRVDEKYIPNF